MCCFKAITNGDGPYPEAGRIGKVVPLPTPVTVTRNVGDEGSDDEMSATSPVSTLDKRHAHCHTMSTRRVCWHRNTSVSMAEHALSVRVRTVQLYWLKTVNRIRGVPVQSRFFSSCPAIFINIKVKRI